MKHPTFYSVLGPARLLLLTLPSRWCLQDGEEATLELPSVNAYQRLLTYQELRRPQFGAAEPPGFFVEVRLRVLHSSLQLLHSMWQFCSSACAQLMARFVLH